MIPLQSLYIHVPFCPHICPYCDFHKMRRNDGLVEAYLERLEEEARERYQEFPVQLETLYFGGGTPSHLSDMELTQIITVLKETWGFPAKLETTLEADPLTFDKERLKFFRDLGFSRLSIGLQSTQDNVLKFLGRTHTGQEGLEAVTNALEAGFEVSADLITGIEGQDTAKDLHTLAQTGVNHISVYSLTIEPFTPFALRGVQRNEDKEANDYELTNQILSSYGLERYEVSSHARAGHEAKHNQVYWHGDYFLALGPSAAGFIQVPGSRFQVSEVLPKPETRNPKPFRYTNPPIKAWLNHEAPEIIDITPERYVQDVLMTGLRTRQGVDVMRLEQRTNINILTHYHEHIDLFINHGLLRFDNYHLSATRAGLLQLNGIVSRFLE
jgi:putative oxygen-independent coproporphyrinogen III oxidase